LLAFGWIEMNPGQFRASASGTVGGCYRVTSSGIRALRLVGSAEAEEEPDETTATPGPTDADVPVAAGTDRDPQQPPELDEAPEVDAQEPSGLDEAQDDTAIEQADLNEAA
jgi:hypothetical protein